jgi:tripeptide aminopeptidase
MQLLPYNTDKKVPVICFCAHVDTAPDCSGTDVKPIVHKNYNGSDIVLPDDKTQVIRMSDYPYMEKLIGHDIITASGKKLYWAVMIKQVCQRSWILPNFFNDE